MSTFVSIHNVKELRASTHDAVPHLSIDFEGNSFDGNGAITFFIEDIILIARLVAAINGVMQDRKNELAALESEPA